jgi:hypothetical protein
MKTLTTLILSIISLCVFSQDTKLIELEFNKLYESYCKTRSIKRERSDLLDSLIIVQVDYLSTFTVDSQLTHLNSDSRYFTFEQRERRFLEDTDRMIGGEVCAMIYDPSFFKKQTEKDIAKQLFTNLCNSPSHKSIMMSRKLSIYQFGVGKYKDGAVFIVGVIFGYFEIKR